MPRRAPLRFEIMTKLMNNAQFHAALATMASRIATAAPKDRPVAVVGIRRRGEVLGRYLIPLLEERGVKVAHDGALDITLYRDDLTTIGPSAVTRSTEINFDITGVWLVLVDDVLYTGRSVRAALSALNDLGRPHAIRLAVMIDRGWRELPIQPDFVGMTVETTAANIVKVKVTELDGSDEVDMV